MKPLFVITLVVLLSPTLIAAQSIDLTLHPVRVDVHTATPVIIDLEITNNQDRPDLIALTFDSKRIWWREPGTIAVPLAAGESTTIAQGFYPVGAEEGEYPFSITARSVEFDTFDKETLVIGILPDVYLTDTTVTWDDDMLHLALDLDVAEEGELPLTVVVRDSQGTEVFRTTQTEHVVGIMTLERSFAFPLTVPGTYHVDVMLDDETLETTFVMPEVRQFSTHTEETASPFFTETSVVVTNVGNVEHTFESEKSFPPGALVTGLVTAPAGVVDTPTEKVQRYEVALQPGQSTEIRYREEFWPIYLQLGVIVVVVAVLGMMIAGKYTNPRINKHYRRRDRKTLSVVLGVKNAYRDSRNVVVRDWVSPLAQVSMEGFESVRPVVRRSDAGTELIWSLGDMRPGEERLISYKIRPMVTGYLKMGRASMRYKDGRGSKRVYSKPVVMEK